MLLLVLVWVGPVGTGGSGLSFGTGGCSGESTLLASLVHVCVVVVSVLDWIGTGGDGGCPQSFLMGQTTQSGTIQGRFAFLEEFIAPHVCPGFCPGC